VRGWPEDEAREKERTRRPLRGDGEARPSGEGGPPPATKGDDGAGCELVERGVEKELRRFSGRGRGRRSPAARSTFCASEHGHEQGAGARARALSARPRRAHQMLDAIRFRRLRGRRRHGAHAALRAVPCRAAPRLAAPRKPGERSQACSTGRKRAVSRRNFKTRARLLSETPQGLGLLLRSMLEEIEGVRSACTQRAYLGASGGVAARAPRACAPS
jgi:hypothetical protein